MAKHKIRKRPRTVAVKAYKRKDGKLVSKHNRSKPDGIKENNHSYKGWAKGDNIICWSLKIIA